MGEVEKLEMIMPNPASSPPMLTINRGPTCTSSLAPTRVMSEKTTTATE
jgi:hypothetical protein